MDIQILLSFALLALVRSHDVTVGLNGDGKKIYEQTFEASPAIWRQAQNVTVNATNEEVISRVIVTDLREDKDGEATIVEGGEGQKNVTVQLKSPTALRGYEFKIEVFAVPDKNVPKDGASDKIFDIEADKAQNNVPIKVGDDKETVGETNTEPKPQDQTIVTPLPPGRFSRENQPQRTIELSKNEDTSKLGVTQSSEIDAKEGNKPFVTGLDKDNQNQEKTATPIPSYISTRTTEPQTKDVFENTEGKSDDELSPEMINGQSMYPNVQPTSNGQLIRTVRATEDISTSADKNIDTTKLPALENSTQDTNQKDAKTGFEASNEKTTNNAYKNLEFSANKYDTPNIHKIPLGKSHNPANDWQTSQSTVSSVSDEAAKSFEDNNSFFTNLGQLTNKQLTERVNNLENSSKTNDNPERKTRETESGTTEASDTLKTSEGEIGNDQNDKNKSNSETDQTQDSNKEANKPIPFIPLPQQGPYDFASTIAPENKDVAQDQKSNSKENFNGEHKLISKVNGEVKKPVISIE